MAYEILYTHNCRYIRCVWMYFVVMNIFIFTVADVFVVFGCILYLMKINEFIDSDVLNLCLDVYSTICICSCLPIIDVCSVICLMMWACFLPSFNLSIQLYGHIHSDSDKILE